MYEDTKDKERNFWIKIIQNVYVKKILETYGIKKKRNVKTVSTNESMPIIESNIE